MLCQDLYCFEMNIHVTDNLGTRDWSLLNSEFQLSREMTSMISPMFDIENLTCYANDKFLAVVDRGACNLSKVSHFL